MEVVKFQLEPIKLLALEPFPLAAVPYNKLSQITLFQSVLMLLTGQVTELVFSATVPLI